MHGLQDTMADVRSSFALKLRRALTVLQSMPSARPAKYAAMLPLAAVDPSSANRENGLRIFVNWVQGRRRYGNLWHCSEHFECPAVLSCWRRFPVGLFGICAPNSTCCTVCTASSITGLLILSMQGSSCEYGQSSFTKRSRWHGPAGVPRLSPCLPCAGTQCLPHQLVGMKFCPRVEVVEFLAI